MEYDHSMWCSRKASKYLKWELLIIKVLKRFPECYIILLIYIELVVLILSISFAGVLAEQNKLLNKKFGEFLNKVEARLYEKPGPLTETEQSISDDVKEANETLQRGIKSSLVVADIDSRVPKGSL